MRKFAIINNFTVTEIKYLDEDGYRLAASKYELVVDIEDLLVQPDVGWVLQGNHLVPPPGYGTDLASIINARIKHYQEKAPEMLRNLYTANTLLGITVQQSDAMFDDYQDVLIRIREGAWPTALYRLSQKQPSGFVTQEMINNWISVLQSGIQ
jgi:hypothetical protein